VARISKWKSYHVKITTLEKVAGVVLTSFREMYPEGDESISLRIPREKWNYYGIAEALKKLGFTDQTVVYINL
jgi:hypothetical protein